MSQSQIHFCYAFWFRQSMKRKFGDGEGREFCEKFADIHHTAGGFA
jgi:hypothetical protein